MLALPSPFPQFVDYGKTYLTQKTVHRDHCDPPQLDGGGTECLDRKIRRKPERLDQKHTRTVTPSTEGEGVNFLGIDPGKSAGAAVLLCGDQAPVVHLFENPMKTVGWLRYIHEGWSVDLCVIEKQQASQVQSNRNSFTAGENYGGWLWALATLKIPTRLVTPKSWQSRIPGLVANSEKSTHKRTIQIHVQQLYPNLRVTQYFSDALAIALEAKYLWHRNQCKK